MGERVFDKSCFYIRRGKRRPLKRLLRKHLYLGHSHEALLIFSAIWHNPKMLPWLLQHGVHPDSRLGNHGNTPLMQAACENEQKTMQLLLAAGADPNARNEANETPLGFACAWTQWAAAAILIRHGADVNAIETDNTTFLDWALTGSHNEGIQLLQANGGMRFAELQQSEST